MPSLEDTLKALVDIVSRQQLAIRYLSEVLPHVADSVYTNGPSHAKMVLDELSSGDFAIDLPNKIESLRAEVGLPRVFSAK